MLTVTGKNPFLIGFADGIFAFKPVFYYGQRSKCADLLNSYQIPSKKDPPESISAFRGSFFFLQVVTQSDNNMRRALRRALAAAGTL